MTIYAPVKVSNKFLDEIMAQGKHEGLELDRSKIMRWLMRRALDQFKKEGRHYTQATKEKE